MTPANVLVAMIPVLLVSNDSVVLFEVKVMLMKGSRGYVAIVMWVSSHSIWKVLISMYSVAFPVTL